MRIYTMILFAIVFITADSYSQDMHLVDSLRIVLKTHNSDTIAANILSELSLAYWDCNFEKSKDYAEKCLILSEQLGYKKGIASAYNSLGSIYFGNGDYPLALEHFLKSMTIRKEIGFVQGIASSYNNFGNVMLNQGNYPEALKNYLTALKINEQLGNYQWQVLNLGNIGYIYEKQGNYPEALKKYFITLQICQKIGDKYGIAQIYNSIGSIYNYQHNYDEALKNHLISLKIYQENGLKNGIAETYNFMAVVYQHLGKYPEALKKYQANIKVNTEVGYKNGVARSYNSIGDIYTFQGDYQKALSNYLNSLNICEKIKDKIGACSANIDIGFVHIKQKNFSKATLYLNKGLAIAKEIGSIDHIKSCYEGFAKLDSLQGNFKKALEHYRLYITTRDSFVNTENTNKAISMQMTYDFNKQQDSTKAEQEKKDTIAEAEIQKSNQQKYFLTFAFLIAIVFAYLDNRKKKNISKEKKRSEDLLLNILPAEVAEELKNNGSAEAKQFDNVTVLFTDFKSFTTVSEQLSPQELVNELHSCFKGFDEIITKYNIEKIKTIGDAYLAVCGLPLSDEKHSENVVNAALEIREFMEKRRQNFGEKTFEVRIGINSGSVVAGIVGVKKFAYDIWGDTVNTAARMEQNSETGRINISQSTYEHVKDKFTCEYRGEIDAKNKGMLKMYFVEEI